MSEIKKEYTLEISKDDTMADTLYFEHLTKKEAVITGSVLKRNGFEVKATVSVTGELEIK